MIVNVIEFASEFLAFSNEYFTEWQCLMCIPNNERKQIQYLNILRKMSPLRSFVNMKSNTHLIP